MHALGMSCTRGVNARSVHHPCGGVCRPLLAAATCSIAAGSTGQGRVVQLWCIQNVLAIYEWPLDHAVPQCHWQPLEAMGCLPSPHPCVLFPVCYSDPDPFPHPATYPGTTFPHGPPRHVLSGVEGGESDTRSPSHPEKVASGICRVHQTHQQLIEVLPLSMGTTSLQPY